MCLFTELTALSKDAEFTSTSIYRVPEKSRKENEAAYTPQLVSIGPFHRERGQLQGMESYKLRCLRNFCNRFSINLPDLVRFLLLKNHFPRLRGESDVIFRNPWMWSDLLHDMLLLENQLPTDVPNGLLDFVQDPSLLNGITFFDLDYDFFNDVGNTEKLPLTELSYLARHFVEFLLIHHSPTERSIRPMNFVCTRSATELQRAGVKFRAKGSCLFDVDFTEVELTLPSFIVNDSTETFFWNLIAFEHCEYSSKDITSYVIFKDNLLNTHNNVDLLVKHGIIENKLGKSKAVAKLFNNLYKEVVTEADMALKSTYTWQADDFYFAKLCEKLNAYSSDQFHEFKSKWFRWREIAKRDYFSTPWSFISLLAATVLLILTVIQTLCSILQVK
ncbi:hypothetical protein CDL12_04618 [Handroanthus impetiginosus]|uniref:DUF247 domain-containing protein n=1 Tax=Handroanthus impetiginosus TaxID=429701 RepID=A0A2G9HYW4_9LAMI|nr:hypothetical protein CDL12_04618 [Handroanthus impetiginosus]